MRFAFTFHLLLLNTCLAFCQPEGVQINGKVVDAESGAAVPYATVALVSKSDSSIISGTTTDDSGYFSIRANTPDIMIEISFIGFEKKRIENFSVKKGMVSLGKISLQSSALDLDAVQITDERSTMEFKLDKRVFNVGSDISSTGMGAMEVLGNVPSVNVSIEGEVSIRGNSGVQILINGKPSVLADDPSSALGTLTADMIESIEVITNPSAKYQAEGTSGILNIVLKKEEKKGFNGSVSANTGIPDNHSIGVSLNQRTENFNFFTQFGAGYRSIPEYTENRNRDLLDNSLVSSEGVEYRNEEFYNITLGADYYLNAYNTLTLSGNFAYEIEDQPSEIDFQIFNGASELISEYRRKETTSAVNPKYRYDLQYKKEFKNNEEHVLLLSTQGNFFGKDLSSVFNNTYADENIADVTQRTETDYYQRDYTIKLDYTNPISEQITIEAGGLYEINDVGNDYGVFNEGANGELIPVESLTNNFEFNQKVLGVYSTAAYEGDQWGVKLGLRAEQTDLTTLLTTTDEKNTQNYSNLFPTLHTSYKWSETFSVQAGYSKRIYRPRLWDLNPFFNIRNSFNIRTGNPNLLPEFADSYELTGIFIFQKLSLNTSVYHLFTRDVKERVSFLEDGVNITTPINVGTNSKVGVELNGKYTAAKWLTIMADFNYGYFNRQGNFEDQNFDFNGDQYSAEMSTKFSLPANIDLEITPNYQSGYKTVQGSVSGYAHMDAGIRKKLWNGKAVVNLGVRDIFASRIRESIAEQETFSFYSYSRRGRFITFGLSYSFGKGEAMTYSGR